MYIYILAIAGKTAEPNWLTLVWQPMATLGGGDNVFQNLIF